MAIRVLIADDQALLRAGFRLILQGDAQIDVVGEAADGGQAIQSATALRPDVILMDIRMPGINGLEATKRIAAGSNGKPRVIILTTYDLDEYVYDALAAGASGFLLKDAPPEDLINAVHLVAAGEALLSPSVTRRLIEEFASKAADREARDRPVDRLTERETQVLKLMATGLSNQEISVQLYLEESTVKSHVARIFAKLEARDRVQAVLFAYESGLVSPKRR